MSISEGLRFTQRHVAAVRLEGLSAVLRKLAALVWVLVAIPVVLIARLVRPLVWIRFGYLPSHRIGHYGLNVEVYLCERDAGMHGRRVIDLFYNGRHICNQQLRVMWGRTLHVSELALWADAVNRCIPGGRRHSIQALWRRSQDQDIHGLIPRTTPHLSFTADEEAQGRTALRSLGVTDGTPYVTFHARDSAYLRAMFPDADWSRHDFRDCDVQTFVPAAEALARRGYVALRMGAIVAAPIHTAHPHVIDYATRCRTDFLDIYLPATSMFFFGADSGLCAVPEIFRRPVAFVNWATFDHIASWGPRDLFIPKKLWLRRERRLLTFRELGTLGVDRFRRTAEFESAGIELVGNTADEITALVLEMDDRLNGRWIATQEDEELQRRLWQQLRSSETKPAVRMGAEFLRQHRALLD